MSWRCLVLERTHANGHRHSLICPWLKLIHICSIHIHSFPILVTLQLLTLVMYEYKVQSIGVNQHWKLDLSRFMYTFCLTYRRNGCSQKQGFMDVIAFNAAISACTSGRLVALSVPFGQAFAAPKSKELTDPEFLLPSKSGLYYTIPQLNRLSIATCAYCA